VEAQLLVAAAAEPALTLGQLTTVEAVEELDVQVPLELELAVEQRP
jgi:hypothetical protein